MSFNIDNVTCPKKIDHSHILSAAVELRVEFSVPTETIIGVLYNEFKETYPKLENLPILQLPEEIRKSDPALIHKAWYQLVSKDKKYLLRVGNKVLSLAVQRPYQGWEDFQGRLKKIMNKIYDLSIVDKYNRVGIRYTSMFIENIFDIIDLNLDLQEKTLTDNKTNIRLIFEKDGFNNILAITNAALVKEQGQDEERSIIDIDTTFNLEQGAGEDSEKINRIIEDGHEMEKKIFFKLVKEDYLKEHLNPEY